MIQFIRKNGNLFFLLRLQLRLHLYIGSYFDSRIEIKDHSYQVSVTEIKTRKFILSPSCVQYLMNNFSIHFSYYIMWKYNSTAI